MESVLYMPVAGHAAEPKSFMKFAKAKKTAKRARTHSAALSCCEKRNKLRKTASFFST